MCHIRRCNASNPTFDCVAVNYRGSGDLRRAAHSLLPRLRQQILQEGNLRIDVFRVAVPWLLEEDLQEGLKICRI
jgi:hypothetical protein